MSSTNESNGAAGLRVLEVAARELTALAERHDGVAIQAAAELIEASESKGGRVHVTGVGKPAHVANYAASLLSSTGTPATFMHATESLHGSLGQIVPGDVVVAIDGDDVTSMSDLSAAIRGYGPDDVVTVTLYGADGRTREVEVTLGGVRTND